MAYEEQESKRSRVVVQTPTSRREVVESAAVRVPERSGISGGTVGVIVVLAVALITILVLLLLSGQSSDSANANLAAQQQPAPIPQTTIVQQPAPQQQPPIVIQQPAPVQQAPVIVNPSAGGATTGTDDGAIQAEIDKRLAEDSTFSSLGLTATVMDGKVTLVGTVKSEEQKAQVERMVRRIKGVKNVDNQISVMP